MRKSKPILFLLLAIFLLISGCNTEQEGQQQTETNTESETTKEKVLFFAIGGDIGNFDPHFIAGLPRYAALPPMFNGLVDFPYGSVDTTQIQGDLAEKWEHNADQTVWTFTLRQGVQWHKGYGELTAEDVKWSFERVMDPANGISFASTYKEVNMIETPDKYTVEFHLDNPDPNFLHKVLNYKGGAIVNKKAIENKEPYIGTGPFQYEDYKPKDEVILAKHKDYFRGEPKLDKIVFKIMTDPTAIDVALEKGEIHMALGSGSTNPDWVKMIQSKDNLIMDVESPKNIGHYYLNMSKPPFDNILVRQAIAHAIDVESYVENLMADYASVPNSVVPSDYFGAANIGRYEYNPEKAKQLLKEAGYENGLTLPVQQTSQQSNILTPMVFAQDALRHVGIEMPLEQIDHTTYQENMRKGMNHFAYVSMLKIPHALYFLEENFYGPASVGTPTAVTNYSTYSGSDELIEAVKFEADPKKQVELYKQIQQEIMDAYAVVPSAEFGSSLVRTKNVILGYDKHVGNLNYWYKLNENTDLAN